MRRRAMLAAAPGVTPAMPSGYVTNGLVFFLDGKQLVSASAWTDIIGGKTFTLHGCTPGANGVAFDGSTSYGEYSGTITGDAANETVEVVFRTGKSPTPERQTFFNQPKIGNSCGVSCLIAGKWSGNAKQLGLSWHADGTTHNSYILFDIDGMTANTLHTLSMHGGALTVFDTVKSTTAYSTSYAANTSGKTGIGRRYTTEPLWYFQGTIHAIRVYSRRLTEAEMVSNQQTDAVRYGS